MAHSSTLPDEQRRPLWVRLIARKTAIVFFVLIAIIIAFAGL